MTSNWCTPLRTAVLVLAGLLSLLVGTTGRCAQGTPLPGARRLPSPPQAQDDKLWGELDRGARPGQFLDWPQPCTRNRVKPGLAALLPAQVPAGRSSNFHPINR